MVVKEVVMFRKLLFSAFVPTLLLTGPANGADPNLVGWWRFNEGSGVAAVDSSGNGLHGELVGEPAWIAGIQGTALQFSGDSHVAVPGYEGILGTHARTSAAWINVNKTSASIITWGPSGAGTKWVMRTHNGPASLRLECGRGNTYGTTDLVDGEWHHVAAVLEDDGSPDVSEVKLYVDGELDAIDPTGTPRAINTSSGGEFRIGYDLNNTGRTFDGMMDDVRIYDRALSADEIQGLIDNPGETVTQALAPSPADGEIIESTWYNLSWTPGDLASSHQLYIADNFEDVSQASSQAIVTEASFVVIGFGESFPDGLVPGTTYYWRVDEVNDAEPESPWRGDIWSFSVRPKVAWHPVPADGALFVEPDTNLTWDPGVGAALHHVYFGENFEDVNSAEGAAATTATTYEPGQLEAGKTYYWRVDGFDGQTVQRGQVWSFTTSVPGGGLVGEYFNAMNPGGQPVLTRTDPAIDVDYGTASPEPNRVDEDGFSVRWRGEIQVAFSEVYTFYTRTNDGSRLWIDEKLIVDKWAWVNRVVDTRSEPIELVAGEKYSIRMEWFNEDGDAEAHLLWESASEPKAIVPAAAFSLPVRAGGPDPSNDAVDVRQTPILSWSPGVAAVSHDVYFGTDEETVRNADTGSPEYKGTRDLGSENYEPGELAWDTTYYWRVDEVEEDGIVERGKVWRFRTADFIIVDDFELYNDLNPDDPGSNRIFLAWIDGFDNPAANGSIVGYANPPFAEQSIVHSGSQSMPFAYDNSVGKSEATLTLASNGDWTVNGVNILTIWYRGSADNAAETLYVALNGNARVDNDDPDAATETSWTEWNIPLQAFADQGVNLSNVSSITLGLSSVTGGSGMMYFDDIRLYAP
jgi:hypothetical protein